MWERGREGGERGLGLGLGLSVHPGRPVWASPEPGLVEQSGRQQGNSSGEAVEDTPFSLCLQDRPGLLSRTFCPAPGHCLSPHRPPQGPQEKEDERLVQALDSRGSDLSVQNRMAPFF